MHTIVALHARVRSSVAKWRIEAPVASDNCSNNCQSMCLVT